MKTILRIAKTELNTLFYSPIAWLILIVFAFQVGMEFCSAFADQIRFQDLEYKPNNLTFALLGGYGSLFWHMQQNLYLYIPLLSMGLMSREYSSGSIKLLYSSPVTNTQIIFGKYLSMMAYALVLIAILFLPAVFARLTVKDLDVPLVMSGLLGIYLLVCAYAAIGLFMSSLTSYQVVAAVGTLALLAVLNFIGGVGQGIEFVRDITYWLSITGRADTLILGLLCSEDILYFLIVIALFLALSILKLQSERQKQSLGLMYGKYSLVVGVAMMLGYISSRPSLMVYYDTTEMKKNTLTEGSRKVMERMDGPLSITTYVNILEENYWKGMPERRNYDLNKFKQYIRFKPETKMNYVYYYEEAGNRDVDRNYPGMTGKEKAEKRCEVLDFDFDRLLSGDEVRKTVDLEPEGYRFVRLIERGDGQRTFLRIYDDNQRDPSETEITAALKRLVTKAPAVGFVTGHGERNINRGGDWDFGVFVRSIAFRYSLINQGFDAREIRLGEMETIPDDISILVITDVKTPYTADELAKVKDYIARGGNLLIACEPRRQENMNPLTEELGIRFLPGTLVQSGTDYVPNLIVGDFTPETADLYKTIKRLFAYRYKITMPGAVKIDYSGAGEKGFEVVPWVTTHDTLAWNELETTDFINETVAVNPAVGEVRENIPLVLSMHRQIGEKEQRVIVLADADCIGNGELGAKRNGIPASNFSLITESFRDLSFGEFPIDTSRPRASDDKLYLGQSSVLPVKLGFIGLIPGLLIFMSITTGLRRKRK